MCVCACARPGGGVGDCALMPSAALTCSWESRGKSEQSCSAPTESEEGRSQQPDPKTGITLQPGGRVPSLASLCPSLCPSFCPSLCPRPLGSLATMRSDFALVLTAALLLDAFWVRFFGFALCLLSARSCGFGAHPFPICRRREEKKGRIKSRRRTASLPPALVR